MKRASPLSLPLAVAVYAFFAWHFDWLCDDAYISFRYARHLAEGQGLVFNPGRGVPVEGYSNFLWVLWLGALERLGLSSPAVSRWSAAVCGALLLWRVWRFLGRSAGSAGAGAGSPHGAEVAVLFLATLPAFGVWATSGLATMPTALSLFLCFECLLGNPDRPRPVGAAAFALATALVRADGAVWVLLLLTGVVLAAPCGTSLARRLRPLLAVIATLVVGVGVHVAWRLSTYGDWLPLTARVKAGFSTARLARGLDYAVAWLLAMPAIPLVLLGTALGARWLPRRVAAPSIVLVLGATAYATWVGGDFMPFGRFLFPTLPFIALLLGTLVDRLWTSSRSLPAITLLAAAFGTSIAADLDHHAVPESLRRRFDFRYDREWQSELERRDEMDLNARRWVLLGRALDLHTTASDSLILGGIGAVGYESDLFIYDTYGLVTPEVVAYGRVLEGASPGHDQRVNPPFFLDHEPALDPRPTLLGAYLTPVSPLADDDPLPWWTDVRPPDWETHRWRPRIDIETYPLDPAAGFPENAQLVLLRIR